MQTKAKDKMMTPQKKEVKTQDEFFYPSHQKTVTADSKDEADKEVEKKQ